MTVEYLVGDAINRLRDLPDDSVHMCMTSPPYWGLRSYNGESEMIGLEKTPDGHLARLVDVFREVRRVLRGDGTLWLNYADAYATPSHGRPPSSKSTMPRLHHSGRAARPPGYKIKDLMLMSALLAMALRADGWWLRAEIIWHKRNGKPESIRDRPTQTHEKLYLLSKRDTYFWDKAAVEGPTGANIRNVWTIARRGFSGDHWATFPPALVEPCIKAGTSARGVCAACGAPWVRNGTGWAASCECAAGVVPAVCLDPFAGSGTVGLVAQRLGRDATLIDISPAYIDLARKRIEADAAPPYCQLAAGG